MVFNTHSHHIVKSANTNIGGSFSVTLAALNVPVNATLRVTGATQLTHSGAWVINGHVSFSQGTAWIITSTASVTGTGSIEAFNRVDIFTDNITVANIYSFIFCDMHLSLI